MLCSCLDGLLYDILLDMVPWNLSSRSTLILAINNEGQGQMLLQPGYSCRTRPVYCCEVWRWSIKNVSTGFHIWCDLDVSAKLNQIELSLVSTVTQSLKMISQQLWTLDCWQTDRQADYLLPPFGGRIIV